MSPALQGIALRLFAVGTMAGLGALVHVASQTVPIGQVIFWRSGVALVPIVIYLAYRKQLLTGIQTKRPGAHLTRGLFGAFSMALSFYSIAYLPLANAQGLSYLAPILSIPVAAFMLGERVAKIVLIACGVAFCGVIAILASSLVQPTVDTRSLIGIACGLGYAFTMSFVRVHIKGMTKTETPASIAFYFAVICTVVGAITSIFGWVPLDGRTTLLLAGTGILGGIAHIASTEAVSRMSVAALAPFDYTALIWALGFDVFIFAHIPDVYEMLGIAAIVGAAILVVSAEIKKPVKAKPSAE